MTQRRNILLSKIGFIIFILLSTHFAQILEIQDSLTTTEDSFEKSIEKTDIVNKFTYKTERFSLISDELKTAKVQTNIGATLYGVGFGASAVGIVIFACDFITDWSSEYNYDASRGLYVFFGGVAMSLGGTIISISGASKAKSIYTGAYGRAPNFNGWKLFAGGVAFSVGGTLLSYSAAQIPYLPSLFLLTGYIFRLSSVIHSCNYTNHLYSKDLISNNINIFPYLDINNPESIGIRLSTDF